MLQQYNYNDNTILANRKQKSNYIIYSCRCACQEPDILYTRLQSKIIISLTKNFCLLSFIVQKRIERILHKHLSSMCFKCQTGITSHYNVNAEHATLSPCKVCFVLVVSRAFDAFVQMLRFQQNVQTSAGGVKGNSYYQLIWLCLPLSETRSIWPSVSLCF